jgi:tRNA A37 methylthiotransferase MiaB
MKKAIIENHIDIVMTGGLNAQFKKIKEIIDTAKEIKPDIKVVAGGGIVTSDPIHAMTALKTADYGIAGEGEITSCCLAYALETNSGLREVCGIVYKDNGGWVATEPREEIKDIDIIPWPDYEGCSYERTLAYESQDVFVGLGKNERGGFISFGRSCPFNCTFCFHTSGSTYRQRSLDSFFEELEWVVNTYQVNYFNISDELLFGKNSKIVDGFCKKIKTFRVKWTCTLRVDMVTRELIAKLKNSGCTEVVLGLESANNTILKSMRKNITVDQIENALNICLKMNIPVNGNFIFGDLEETFETAMDTIHWWQTHTEFAICIRMNWISTYPGTHLYKEACRRGIISDPIQFIGDECPVINVSKMSFGECLHLSSYMALAGNDPYPKFESVILFLKTKGIVAEGNCPVCHSHNTYRNINIFPPVMLERCGSCGKLFSLYAKNYLDPNILKHNVESLVSGHIAAIYPVTYTIFDLVKTAPALADPNVYIVDSSAYKQGQAFLGKLIHSPDIIRRKNIDTVFISSVSETVIREIVETITENYPSVTTIKCISELCF